ncbi:MAG: hypothetical protein ACLQVI_16015 [Polyangiaceae bacterium]|jgi:hypothetical protein
MLTRRRMLALACLTIAVAFGALSRQASAQGPKPRVEIVVLYAKADPKGGHMGPGVPQLPQLTQPPFNAYNTFALVGQTTLTLDQPKPDDPWKGKASAVYSLVNGKPIRIAMIEQLADKRFHMGATIGKDAPDVVRWDAPGNEPVFIAGQSYKDGILVIGITLRAP